MANLIQIKRSTTASAPGSLANGELAYTSNGDVLYIGSPNGSVVAIGGVRVPGFLTANQALVANTTGYLNEIRAANLVATKIYANGTFGTSNQVLTSNSTGGIFWNTPLPSVVGTNTQIQFNDSGSLNATASFTFDKSTNTVGIGSGTINSTNYSGTANNANNLGGAAASAYVNTSGSFSLNGNLNFFGACTYFNNTVKVGSTVTINSTMVNIGNAAAYTNVGYGNASFSAYVSGNLVTTNVSATGLLVGANVVVNTSTIAIGSNFVANSTTVAIGSGVGLQANGGVGTAGQVLLSNASSVYWGDRVSSVATGNGLIGGTITTTGTLSVLANNGIVANASGVFVNPGTGVTVNATGVHIGQPVAVTDSVTFDAIAATGNVVIGNNVVDNISFLGRANTNFNPAANATYDIGASGQRWNYVWAANVHATRGYVEGNLEVGGDLLISGNLITTNVSSVIVSDPLIILASNNTTSDLVDIGFTGHYYDGSTQRHTGVIRHAATDAYYLFKNYTTEPGSNVVDINDPSFKLSSVWAYLNSSGITTNATSVVVTANSTVNVAIVANSISISSPLMANSGGTGINTVTNNAILFGNSTNGFSQLSLGTSGYVLQSNGTALVYDILDGGTF